jgi:hypothetical protein
MGNFQAAEFAGLVGEGAISLEQAIGWHLQSNHYPPVPLSMVPVCIEAIEAGQEEDWGRLIELPEGVLWRGKNSAPASALVEAHHLDSWLQELEDE